MKKFRIELKWGFIFFLSGLAWMVLEKSLGWHDRLIEHYATYSLLYAPLAIFIFVVALWEKKKKTYRGRITFLQGLISGLVITLVVVLLTPLSQYISHTLISPNYFPNMIQYTVSSSEKTLPEAEAFFNLMNSTTQAMFFAVGMGILTTIVVMVFMKAIPQKDPSE